MKTKINKIQNKRIIYPIIILVITLITYSGSINNDFVWNWDDNEYIIENPVIKDISLNSLFTHFKIYQLGNYHPLTTISYAIEYKLFGENPLPYHINNITLHLINSLLVFIFIKKLTGKNEMAAIVSLLFAIHPLHTESVAWISERKDLLFTVFYLASLIFYMKYLKESVLDDKNIKNKTTSSDKKVYIKKFIPKANPFISLIRSPLTISTFLFLLSLFSKAMGVSLPVVLLLIDYLLKRKLNIK